MQDGYQTRSRSAVATSTVFAGLFLTLSLALSTAGCLSSTFVKRYPQKQRYSLVVSRAVEPRTAGKTILRVGRVRIAPLFERKSFVYRFDDATYKEDFYNEFVTPPGVAIQGALREWMVRSAVFASVIDPGANADADWLLEARVERLYADLSNLRAPKTVFAVDYVLRDARSVGLDVVYRRSYGSVVPLSGSEPKTIALGWGEAVSQTLEELESDLRAFLRR